MMGRSGPKHERLVVDDSMSAPVGIPQPAINSLIVSNRDWGSHLGTQPPKPVGKAVCGTLLDVVHTGSVGNPHIVVNQRCSIWETHQNNLLCAMRPRDVNLAIKWTDVRVSQKVKWDIGNQVYCTLSRRLSWREFSRITI